MTPEFLADTAARLAEAALLRLKATGQATVTLATYATDNDLRRLTGEPLTVGEHGQIVRLVAERLRAEGIEVATAEIDFAGYTAWLAGRPNTSDARAEYAATKRPPYRLGMMIGARANFSKDGIGVGNVRAIGFAALEISTTKIGGGITPVKRDS